MISITKGMSSSSMEEATAPHFVLIHGASHGGWCWYKLRCLLESVGYRVTCLDLAGSGLHPSDPDSVFTFDEYNKPLLDFMATLSVDQKVILVGHSAGGTNVTQIIQEFPQKLQAVVFVAAAMYPSGKQTDGEPPSFDEHGDIWTYGYGLGVDQPPTSVIVKPEYLRELYYNMSPLEDLTLAKMLLRPCPVRALGDANFATDGGDDRWERVPRVYIKTLHDHMMNREREDAMLKKWPPSQLYEIDSDHCAFFSNPSALFGLLVKVAMAFS